MTFADLNGDGLLDMISASDGPQVVCTRLANGDGAFDPAVFTEVNTCAAAPIVADFNGDDNPDVVVLTHFYWSDGAGKDFALMLGNGDGTLGPPTVVDSGSWGLWGAAVGDFDEDDVPDVLVANFVDGVQLHLGTGDGGIDLILVEGEMQVAVQIKRRCRLDSVELVAPVRELLGACILAGMREAIFVTSAPRFSAGAKRAAQGATEQLMTPFTRFELVDKPRFIEMLNLVSRSEKQPWQQHVPERLLNP